MRLTSCFIFAAATLAAASAAKADEVFTFVETGQTGNWPGISDPLLFPLTFELTNAAVAGGSFSFSEQNFNAPGLPPIESGSPGLVAFSNFATPASINGDLRLNLTFGPGGNITSGSVFANDTLSDYELSGTGSAWSGTLHSDSFPDSCQNGAPCTVAGYWTASAVPVPEPGSLPLFLAATIGMMLFRRRLPARSN